MHLHGAGALGCISTALNPASAWAKAASLCTVRCPLADGCSRQISAVALTEVSVQRQVGQWNSTFEGAEAVS